MDVDLEEALSSVRQRSKRGESDARKAERAKRRTRAVNLMSLALRNIHAAEASELYRQALIKIDAEAGPLPD